MKKQAESSIGEDRRIGQVLLRVCVLFYGILKIRAEPPFTFHPPTHPSCSNFGRNLEGCSAGCSTGSALQHGVGMETAIRLARGAVFLVCSRWLVPLPHM